MTFIWGGVLAAGILLALSPWVWPVDPTRTTEPKRGRMTLLLESAGYARLSPGMVIATSLCAAALAGAVAWLVAPVPVIALVAGIAGALAPMTWLRSRAARLVKARRALWPDICDLLIASVRAGMSLPDAVSTLGESAPAELRPAFRAFARDMAASGHFESSIDRLKIALSDPVADRIVETLRMARQVGGTELTPVLRALSVSVRADAALRGEVEARQSWIRGAAVLGVIAPWVIVLLLATRPEGAEAYTSPEGVALIATGAAVSFVAFRLMLRVGRLPEPRRWFA